MKKKKYKGNYKAKKAYSSKKHVINKPKKKKKLFGAKKITYQEQKHKSGMNYYVDKNGDYKQKPFFANFWKEGFLDDVPVGSDYNRVMDGVVHTDSIIDPRDYENHESYLRAVKRAEHRHLYGLERAQMSLLRLWNGSPREWAKTLFRIALLVLVFSLAFAIGRPLLEPIFG